MRYYSISMVTILILLLIAALPINSAGSSLQQEIILPNRVTVGKHVLSLLHVDGGYLKDEVGNIVTLRGVCWSTSDWQYDTRNLLSEVQFQYMASWNANVVRTPINLRKIQTDATYQEYFDNFVDYAENNGLYVILGVWGFDHDWSSQDWKDWEDGWDYVSNRYSGKNFIIYNLLNEPYVKDMSLTTFVRHMEDAVDTIRENRVDAIIMMDELQHDSLSPGGWRTLNYLPTYEISRTNVFYDFHHYMGQDWQDTEAEIISRLTSAGIYSAKTNGYCIIAGETNVATEQWSRTSPYAPSSQGLHALNITLGIYDDEEWGVLAWAWSTYLYPPILVDWQGSPNQAGELFQYLLQR